MSCESKSSKRRIPSVVTAPVRRQYSPSQYAQALDNLGRSIRRTQESRRHVMAQRDALAPEQRRALSRAMERLRRENERARISSLAHTVIRTDRSRDGRNRRLKAHFVLKNVSARPRSKPRLFDCVHENSTRPQHVVSIPIDHEIQMKIMARAKEDENESGTESDNSNSSSFEGENSTNVADILD